MELWHFFNSSNENDKINDGNSDSEDPASSASASEDSDLDFDEWLLYLTINYRCILFVNLIYLILKLFLFIIIYNL
jgi:hypothetical protein